MENIISALIGAAGAIIVCIINNNTLRSKTQQKIEMEVQAINATNDKNAAVLSERLKMMSEQIVASNSERNELIKRMYNAEADIRNHSSILSNHELRLNKIDNEIDDIKDK